MVSIGEMSEWSKEPDSKSGVVLCITVGSNPTLSGNSESFGEVSEWSKVHDWKSCMVKSHRGFESPSLRSAADTWQCGPPNPVRAGMQQR